MLSVILTPTPKCVYSAPGYFDFEYEDEWLEDPVVKQMVLDVDKTILVSPNLCQSPVLGPIPPSSLSGGVKGLILILKDPKHREFSSTIFGGNCVPWLTRLSFSVDYTIHMEHSLEFYGGNTPILATGQDGTSFTTEIEVWRWYVQNYNRYQN